MVNKRDLSLILGESESQTSTKTDSAEKELCREHSGQVLFNTTLLSFQLTLE